MLSDVYVCINMYIIKKKKKKIAGQVSDRVIDAEAVQFIACE